MKNLSANKLLEEFMNTVPDVVYIKDKKGRFLFVNEAHARGAGCRPKELIGKTDYDIFPKEKARRMAKDDEFVFTKGKSIIDKIERSTRVDGVDNYVSTTKIPRFDTKRRVIGLIGMTRDVTRRVRRERLHQRRARREQKIEMLSDFNEMKSEFVSTVSHEIKTPLAIIKQLVLLLLNENVGSVSQRQREALVKASKNLDRLQSTVDKLLDISKIEGKRLTLRYSLVNINTLLKDSEKFFKELAAEKNIRLRYHYPQKEVNLFVDADRIVQILTNLVNNAIKFTEEHGHIDVKIDVLETKVRIGVIDSGEGIAPLDIPHVFEKFTQMTKDSKKAGRGIGLGLSIVRELVERHGGEIWVESKLGLGSQFYFTLPRFYTAQLLGKRVKDNIKRYLQRRQSVCLVNILIVNYEEFRKKIGLSSAIMQRHWKKLIKDVCGSLSLSSDNIKNIAALNMGKGKYSVLFPNIKEEIVNGFCRRLRDTTKRYFTERKMDDVFIALGILSYPSTSKAKTRDMAPEMGIREMYIGAEVRRFKRIKYKTKLNVISPLKKKAKCETVDLSQGGLCFIAPMKLKTDEKITVRLRILKRNKWITAKGRVSWIKQCDPQPGRLIDVYRIGLEFIDLKATDRKMLLKELKLYYE